MKIIKFLDDTNELEIEATTQWARTLGAFLHWAVEGDYAYIDMLYPVGEEDILDNFILRLKDIELPDNVLLVKELEFTKAHAVAHIYKTVSDLAFKEFPKHKHAELLSDLDEAGEQYRAYRERRKKNNARA